MVYRILAWFLRVVTRVFFRQVEIVGVENIPPTGGVLFAGNHPNSLIDPILIITSCGRKVHFAAKDTLFKGRLMRAVLRGLGAVPIRRRDDRDGTPPRDAPAQPVSAPALDNESAFAAMFAVLESGGAIGIFPEGLSHDDSQLARLKTGAARLALGGAHRATAPISIVPCGLTFIHPRRFRSRVLVQYGPPIVVSPQEPPTADAVRALTAELDGALRRLTINAPDWETVRALDTVRRLYQPLEISIGDRVELARRFNTHYGAVAADPRVVELMRRVCAYQVQLDVLGITDRELARDLSNREIAARMMRHVTLLGFWLPLMVPGAPLHVPAVAFARIAGPRLTPRKDVIATTKLLSGMLLVLAAYAAAVAVLWWRAGVPAALAAAIVLPLSGIATLRVLDRAHLVRRGFGVLVRRLRFRRAVAALRRDRAQLVGDVIRVVTEVKPATLPALFPRREQQHEEADVPRRAPSNAERDAEPEPPP
ncbi:MAG TPA: lysophospholipid acyltransferase family protein [Kofleriaceae bacterium]